MALYNEQPLPLCDVGHDISSTGLFIRMELSPLNKLQGKISCHLFKTYFFSSRDLISSWVKLISALIGQISEIVGLSYACLHFVPPM
jgi:hypothetical protein